MVLPSAIRKPVGTNTSVPLPLAAAGSLATAGEVASTRIPLDTSAEQCRRIHLVITSFPHRVAADSTPLSIREFWRPGQQPAPRPARRAANRNRRADPLGSDCLA